MVIRQTDGQQRDISNSSTADKWWQTNKYKDVVFMTTCHSVVCQQIYCIFVDSMFNQSNHKTLKLRIISELLETIFEMWSCEPIWKRMKILLETSVQKLRRTSVRMLDVPDSASFGHVGEEVVDGGTAVRLAAEAVRAAYGNSAIDVAVGER